MTRREKRHGDLDRAKAVVRAELTELVNFQVAQRFEAAKSFLAQAYPSMTKPGIEERAANLACFNRAERRKNGFK